MNKKSFTYKLNPEEQARLEDLLLNGDYRPTSVPHTRVSAEAPNCKISLYTSGKCLVQGKEAKEWVTFTLEPLVLQQAQMGYAKILDPKIYKPHMGVDESGKGDFLGPIVIACAYVDSALTSELQKMDVRDSKTITSDKKTLSIAKDIRQKLGDRYSLVTIGPRAYNRLYASMRNVNQILAWGHARAIENLLEKVPTCPRAVVDQFGPTRQVEQALMKKGRTIELEQRPKAESDIAVAAASILKGRLKKPKRLRKKLLKEKALRYCLKQQSVILKRRMMS